MDAVAAREFTILEKAYRAGVPVPTPARRADNMFTMRFLGDDQRAPLLKDADLERPDEAAKQAIALVEKLIDAFIVHSDLSEYNIVMWGERLFAIDFPQAVDFSSRVTRHLRIEEAKPMLLRDLRNLQNYFTKHDVVLDAESEYHRLLEKLPKN